MKKTLVFGASLNPHRYSNLAIYRLVNYGIETYAFGLVSGEVHGVKIQTNISEIEDLDTISLYMNPRRQENYYQDIIKLNPRRVIFNPGTENPELVQLALENDIDIKYDCALMLLEAGQL